MGYQPLTTDDKEYPIADPSVATMTEAFAVEVRAGDKDRASREVAAKQMGFKPEACDDELSRPDYIVAMCRVLFPTAASRIKDGNVNVPEVIRAAKDFFGALS